MAKPVNLIGKKFGKLTVIERAENNNRGNTMWLCRCDCGKEKIALGYDLTHNRTVSCGCNLSGTVAHNRKDLVGNRYGKLIVKSLNKEKSQNGKLYWNCLCDCGNTHIASGGNLKSGAVSSCGCNYDIPRHKDLSGMRFGRLLVIDQDGNERPAKWKCRCECGSEVVIKGRDLLRGHRKSCGCIKGLKDDIARSDDRIRIIEQIGKDAYKTLRAAWGSMKVRCTPKYHDRKTYYDRGIKVCEEWKDFYSFAEWSIQNGFEVGLTIDRIDNYKGYEPSNCRWTDMKTQQNNKRTNVYITYMGRTQTMSQWCDELNLSYAMVKERRKHGWEVPRLFEPRHMNKYR